LGHDGLFVPHHQMRSAGHPFYQALDAILRDAGFDKYAEKLCSRFYRPVTGRPGLARGNYFRSLLVGYFEGIDSERIACRLADSLSLRDFLGLPTEKAPPDHSTISRTRRLIDEETHQEIFAAALHNIPNKRVRNCGMVDITEESKPRLLALSPRSAILPR
jgi:transposase